MDETRQLANRYREALQRIVDVGGDHPWCRLYAECDHIGCKVSAQHIEIAQAALDLQTAPWPLRV